MDRRRATVIVNPAAGGGRGRGRAARAVAELKAAGWSLEVVESSAPGHARTLAAHALDAGADTLIAAGGDGTLFEVVNGIPAERIAGQAAVRVGVLPVGTGNSFLRDFRVSDLRTATARLASPSATPVDLVRARHASGSFLFANLLSLGFSAEAARRTNARWKPFGAAGYVGAVLESLARLTPHRVPFRLDGGPVDETPVTLVAFSNSRYTGGAMHIAPGASLTDGRLDVVRALPMSRLGLLGAFPSLFRGTHVTRPDVRAETAVRVDFLPSGPRPVMVDGEVMELAIESLEVVPRAIEVLA